MNLNVMNEMYIGRFDDFFHVGRKGFDKFNISDC